MTTVCVVVSVRDGEAYLADAIESVLAQTHADLELRIYDNLSRDESARIARRYLADPRVSYTANDRDLGYYGSLNRALHETACSLFVPFAADDLMTAENLERKVAAIERTGAGFAYSPVHTIDETGAVTGELGRPAEPLDAYPAPTFFGLVAPVNSVTCPSVVASTAALRALGGFDGRIPYCADWHAWLRLSLRRTVAYVDGHLVAGASMGRAAPATRCAPPSTPPRIRQRWRLRWTTRRYRSRGWARAITYSPRASHAWRYISSATAIAAHAVVTPPTHSQRAPSA